MVPQEVIIKYNLDVKTDENVYFEIRRGMYGLKESVILAFTQLVKKLALYGYEPMQYTTGLWHHKSRVDNFDVKYFSRDDAHHIINAVKNHYDITVDWEGKLYCGLNLKWNYEKGYINISMDNYIRRALQKFDYKPPNNLQHTPHL